MRLLLLKSNPLIPAHSHKHTDTRTHRHIKAHRHKDKHRHTQRDKLTHKLRDIHSQPNAKYTDTDPDERRLLTPILFSPLYSLIFSFFTHNFSQNVHKCLHMTLPSLPRPGYHGACVDRNDDVTHVTVTREGWRGACRKYGQVPNKLSCLCPVLLFWYLCTQKCLRVAPSAELSSRYIVVRMRDFLLWGSMMRPDFAGSSLLAPLCLKCYLN